MTEKSLPVAVDAMGGDYAPDQIVEGARLAKESGIPIVLFGTEQALDGIQDIETIYVSEVVEMDEDPGQAVRRKKDSSLIRAAEYVRDGHSAAMVSAGKYGCYNGIGIVENGKVKGVARPAIATPIPTLEGTTLSSFLTLGLMQNVNLNGSCNLPKWAQFIRGTDSQLRSLKLDCYQLAKKLEKGNSLIKDSYEILNSGNWETVSKAEFIGNVEGRDLMSGAVDVVVTDGFTGNVALKTLEGTAKAIVKALFSAFSSSEDAKAGADLLGPSLLPLISQARSRFCWGSSSSRC